MNAPVALPIEELPNADQLGPVDRTLFHGAVGFDYLLRTGLGSLITATSIPTAVTGGLRGERELFEFYADLAADRDASKVFAKPDRAEIFSTPGEGPRRSPGRVELLRFESAYQAVNPEMRRQYARYENNGVARAQHWIGEGEDRPTLCVIHGFGASPSWFNSLFFSLERIFASGWDILLYTLPFHGSRRSDYFPGNGFELFARGMSVFSEGIIQAVHDFRVFVDYLEQRGTPRIGLTGLSLGGYTSALISTVEDRLDFVVPNSAVIWLPELFDDWFPINIALGALRSITAVPDDELEAGLAVHSPLNYDPVIPKDRLMIVGGLGDRLAPPEQSLLLWEHWGRPELHWFPGSHIIHFGRAAYQEAMRRLMEEPGTS